jgi:hypothetical protein
MAVAEAPFADVARRRPAARSRKHALAPEAYAPRDELRFHSGAVRLQVYVHHLAPRIDRLDGSRERISRTSGRALRIGVVASTLASTSGVLADAIEIGE